MEPETLIAPQLVVDDPIENPFRHQCKNAGASHKFPILDAAHIRLHTAWAKWHDASSKRMFGKYKQLPVEKKLPRLVRLDKIQNPNSHQGSHDPSLHHGTDMPVLILRQFQPQQW